MGCPEKRFFRSENIPFEPDPGNAGVGITRKICASSFEGRALGLFRNGQGFSARFLLRRHRQNFGRAVLLRDGAYFFGEISPEL